MEEHEARLNRFMKDSGAEAEHLVFQASCHSVEEAAASAEASPSEFVKNICLIVDGRQLVVAIIPGPKRLDTNKLSIILGTKRIRFASAQEVLERTGYPAGGTPSFGYEARFLIDRDVLSRPYVYSGGGSQRALVRIAPVEIVRLNRAREADISK